MATINLPKSLNPVREFAPYYCGQPIEVLMHTSATNSTEWVSGTFIQSVHAIDRDYRINCRLDNMKYIESAAPECVRSLK